MQKYKHIVCHVVFMVFMEQRHTVAYALIDTIELELLWCLLEAVLTTIPLFGPKWFVMLKP